MALNVPSTPSVKSKIYENFKGVDYTNDATNAWYRRSPSGVNMLPDASGRPFKRNGWQVVKTSEDLRTAKTPQGQTPVSGKFEIDKCYYFTLSGISCIVIFSSDGVFLFKEGVLTYLDDDSDLVQSFDRAFFFEGNGKSAFYVYGGSNVWMIDETFTLKSLEQKLEGEEEITIPTILIGTDASTGSGTVHYAYNLLGSKVAVEYTNDLMCFAESEAVTPNVNETEFVAKTSATRSTSKTSWVFEKTASSWKIDNVAFESGVTLADYGVSFIGDIETGDTITVHYGYGVLLPQVVDVTNTQTNPIDERMKVEVTTITQYDTSLNILTSGTATVSACVVKTTSKCSWIEFSKEYTGADQTDSIKVIYPSVIVEVTNVSGHVKNATATLE